MREGGREGAARGGLARRSRRSSGGGSRTGITSVEESLHPFEGLYSDIRPYKTGHREFHPVSFVSGIAGPIVKWCSN